MSLRTANKRKIFDNKSIVAALINDFDEVSPTAK